MNIKISKYPRGYKQQKNGEFYYAPTTIGVNNAQEFSDFVENLKEPIAGHLGYNGNFKGANGCIGGILKSDNLMHNTTNIVSNQLLMFDYDDTYKCIYEEHIRRIREKGYNFVAFSSASHEEGRNTVRKKLIVPLENPVEAKFYKEACFTFLHSLGLENIKDEEDIDAIFHDKTFLQHSHIQFLPTIKSSEWKEKHYKVESCTTGKYFNYSIHKNL